MTSAQPGPGQRGPAWLAALPLIGLGIAVLVALGLVSTTIGGPGMLVGTMAAALPVTAVVSAFLWVDRWEPEPSRLLLAAFLWGAGVSVLGAGLVNDAATTAGERVLGAGGGDLVASVISAPLAEEAFKGAFLVGLLWWWRREFDGVVDGIVYAGLVAAGFAFTENILYFGRAFALDGGVAFVFLVRGVLAPFAHPVFTAMTGICAGLVARRRSLPERMLLPPAVYLGAGYLGAVGLHALWNASAGLGYLPAFYSVIMVPLFGSLIALVLWQHRREQRMVSAALPGFASAGWIAPSEVPLLASQVGRRGWLGEVRRRAGDDAAGAVRDYQNAVNELAFLADRVERGTASPDTRRWHHEAVADLIAARDRAVRAPARQRRHQ
ncbi:MAG TPA: PrsW family intramembrane metalloprotease [Pseudonocardiaceae bacterium]|nr:PrsW family intramembrane metalloprotease [Pseudonocardiaceae bacterium]